MNRILEELARGQPVSLENVAVGFSPARDSIGILISALHITQPPSVGTVYEVCGRDLCGPEVILNTVLRSALGPKPKPRDLYLRDHGVVIRQCYLVAANTTNTGGGMFVVTNTMWKSPAIEEFTPPEDDLPEPLIVPAN